MKKKLENNTDIYLEGDNQCNTIKLALYDFLNICDDNIQISDGLLDRIFLSIDHATKGNFSEIMNKIINKKKLIYNGAANFFKNMIDNYKIKTTITLEHKIFPTESNNTKEKQITETTPKNQTSTINLLTTTQISSSLITTEQLSISVTKYFNNSITETTSPNQAFNMNLSLIASTSTTRIKTFSLMKYNIMTKSTNNQTLIKIDHRKMGYELYETTSVKIPKNKKLHNQYLILNASNVVFLNKKSKNIKDVSNVSVYVFISLGYVFFVLLIIITAFAYYLKSKIILREVSNFTLETDNNIFTTQMSFKS